MEPWIFKGLRFSIFKVLILYTLLQIPTLYTSQVNRLSQWTPLSSITLTCLSKARSSISKVHILISLWMTVDSNSSMECYYALIKVGSLSPTLLWWITLLVHLLLLYSTIPNQSSDIPSLILTLSIMQARIYLVSKVWLKISILLHLSLILTISVGLLILEAF